MGCQNTFWTLLLSSILIFSEICATDLVYTRSKDYGQLITSSTMRWVKGNIKDPVILGPVPSGTQNNYRSSGNGNKLEGKVICRVFHAGSKNVGLLSHDESVCNVDEQDLQKLASNSRYQWLTGSASKLIWIPWSIPNLPPPGAIAISEKDQYFLAANEDFSSIGYLNPKLGQGAIVFPKTGETAKSGLILTEIEPRSYELTNVELKKAKNFQSEDIVLDEGILKYEETKVPPSSPPNQRQMVETIISYEMDEYDYWGIGHLMVKGLPTFINLPSGWTQSESTRTIEWGIPLVITKQQKTLTASAQLLPGTAIPWTLKGTKLNGESSYWANLKTYFMDDSSSDRYIEGIRKLMSMTDIRVEWGRPYFLSNGSTVIEPTTTTTTTTTIPSTTTSIKNTNINPTRSKSGESNMVNDRPSETLPQQSAGNAITRRKSDLVLIGCSVLIAALTLRLSRTAAVAA